MTAFPTTYADIVVKRRVEAWADGLDFDPSEQIFMLLEDKFGVEQILVLDARPEGDGMMLTIGADVWKEPREFALLKSGSLAW